MKAIEYLKAKARFCTGICNICPLSSNNNEEKLYCDDLEIERPEIAVELVEKWAKENPQKTYLSGLLEKFPNAELNSEGYPFFCAISIYGDLHKPNCTYTACRDCWNREYKEK